MKYLIIILAVALTGCATRQIQGSDGKTYTWIAPLPSGDGYASGRSAGVTTHTGMVNGRGYSVSSFK